MYSHNKSPMCLSNACIRAMALTSMRRARQAQFGRWFSQSSSWHHASQYQTVLQGHLLFRETTRKPHQAQLGSPAMKEDIAKEKKLPNKSLEYEPEATGVSTQKRNRVVVEPNWPPVRAARRTPTLQIWIQIKKMDPTLKTTIQIYL